MLRKGISPEEIIAIGDDNNDAQMIKKMQVVELQ